MKKQSALGAVVTAVVIEFESYAAAVECYHSEAYQTAVALRKDIAAFDFVILEGVLPA